MVRERTEGTLCMLRTMEAYLTTTAGGATDPLFPTEGGGKMRTDTPRGRLRHWLRRSGMKDTRAFGFHSLRAGAATQSAREGVSEQHIKLHGNWKSNAVQAYIRSGREERLHASDALGGR